MNYQTHVKSESISLLRFWDVKDWAPIEIISRCSAEYFFTEIHCELTLMKLWQYHLKKNTAKHTKESMNCKRYNTAFSRGEIREIHMKHGYWWLLKKMTQIQLWLKEFWTLCCWLKNGRLQQAKHCTGADPSVQIFYLVWTKQIQLQPLHQPLETAEDTLQDALKNINASKARWKLLSGVRFWGGSTL